MFLKDFLKRNMRAHTKKITKLVKQVNSHCVALGPVLFHSFSVLSINVREMSNCFFLK